MGDETSTTQETQFVLRRMEEALRLFGRDLDARWVWIFWILVLFSVVGGGIFYVISMYRRDSRTINWPWAAFLASLRSLVYLILAAVFLLPALQTWEKSETHSKVVVLFDVSGSMGTKDDTPTDTIPVEKLRSRQDKVIDFLTDPRIAFLKELQKTNPVYAYRFGGRADEEFKVFMRDEGWSSSEWSAWLRPNPKEKMPENLNDEDKARFLKQQELRQQLVGDTNLGDSLSDVVNRELNNMLQGIIVVSDGRNTQPSPQALEEVRTRAHSFDSTPSGSLSPSRSARPFHPPK